MARLIGPDEASRKVETIDSSGRFTAKRSRPATVYADAGATQLADILTTGGAPIADSVVTTDAYSMLPLFQFPDGVDTLWVVVDGGPAWPMYARTDDRLDAVKATADAAETPAGAQAKANAAQAAAIAASAQRAANLSDLANAATSRTNLGLAGAATRNVGTTAGTVAAGDDSRIIGAVQASLVDAKGDLIVGTAGDTVARLPVGADGLALVADPSAPSGLVWRPSDPNRLATGGSTLPRELFGTNTGLTVGSSGTLRLTHFTAPRSESLATIVSYSGSSAAGATPTLCRMGIYSVDGSGNLTLVAACANDTSLWGSTNTRYARSLTSTAAVVGGQRYALGLLAVTGAALPTFVGLQTTGLTGAQWAQSPAMTSQMGGQTDLPSSVPAGSLSASGNAYHMEVIA